MFDFGWLAGNAKTSLTEPNSVVLTQEVAEKYFGDWRSAIGKTIKHDNKYTYKVTGIIKNVPANTDFPLSVVVSYSTLKKTNIERNLNDWVSTFGQAYTFVALPAELSLGKFNARLKSFAKKHKPAENAKDVFIAQAVNRSKEVGVRKVLGSNRSQLAFQFLGETALITVTAVVIAVVIAEAALPFLNKLLETMMTMNFIANPILILFVVIVTIFVTLLSGLYPAIILSGFNPVTALKSKVTFKMVGGISLRRALVVLQFAIAQMLIIGMLIVVSQMDYFKNASLGFDKASIVNVAIPGEIG